MSIASEITALSGHMADAYTKVSDKGGTLPVNQTMKNLPDAIDSIPTGGGGEVTSVTIDNKSTFTGGIAMPTNGTYREEDLQITVSPSTAPQLVTVISSDATVANPVYKNGAYSLRFLKPGEVTIRVQDYTGTKADTMTFNVTQATSSITLNNFPAFSDKGTTYQLTASFVPASSSVNGVTWSTSNSSIATVSNTGLVTFVDVGAVTITATVNGYSSVTASKSTTVVVNETDPDFDAISALIQAGTAETTYPVGSTLNVQYSENGGTTTYTMPLVIMDYKDVEISGGTTKKGMVVMPKFAGTGTQRYSKAITVTSLTASSGETTAQAGYYYYTSSNVPLNYETGDTLDFSVNPTIKKTDYNVDTAQKLNSLIGYGDRRWEYSNARTWLNNTYVGYYSSSFTSHLAEVKVTTVDDAYVWSSEVRNTYDKFFLPSCNEVYAGTTNLGLTQLQVQSEGDALDYFVSAIGTAQPSYSATTARVVYGINNQTASPKYWWTRSVDSSGSNGEFYVYATGNVNNSSAYNSRSLVPLAVLI